MSESAAPRIGGGQRALWLVRTNHRYRAGSLGMVFVALVPHLRGEASAHLWVLLGGLCLVYPHLAYLRARRAADPQAAELANLVVDSLLWGGMLGALHFPLWPTGVMVLSTQLNSTVCGGLPVVARSALAMPVGMLASVALVGFEVRPHTHPVAAALLVTCFATYLISIGLVSHRRYEQLRQAREKLRAGEQALEQQLVEIRELQERLSEQAIRDPLTGLFNRRYLETIVPHELARRARDETELVLMMIDIDHFKAVNDTYGHQGGDEVLKALGSLLSQTVRGSDVACRYGGEEFLLLLPDMPADRAVARAEQWRREFAALEVASGDSRIRATLSIGVAVCPADGASMDELVRAADLALYDAKAGGRDQVVVASGAAAPVAGRDALSAS